MKEIGTTQLGILQEPPEVHKWAARLDQEVARACAAVLNVIRPQRCSAMSSGILKSLIVPAALWLIRLLLLGLAVLGQQHRVDVGQHAAVCDRHAAHTQRASASDLCF